MLDAPTSLVGDRALSRATLRLSYAFALLVPIIGFVLGVVAAARGATVHGIGVMVAALAAAALWGAVIVDAVTADQECSALVEGLCRVVPEGFGFLQFAAVVLLGVVPAVLIVLAALRR